MCLKWVRMRLSTWQIYLGRFVRDMNLKLEPCTLNDAAQLAELRVLAMRPSLEPIVSKLCRSKLITAHIQI